MVPPQQPLGVVLASPSKVSRRGTLSLLGFPIGPIGPLRHVGILPTRDGPPLGVDLLCQPGPRLPAHLHVTGPAQDLLAQQRTRPIYLPLILSSQLSLVKHYRR